MEDSFEQLFNAACFPDVSTIARLSASALKGKTIIEKHLIVNFLSKCNDKGLLPLYVYDSVMKKDGGAVYAILIERVVIEQFITIYKHGDDVIKNKMEKLHKSWEGVFRVTVLKKLKLEMEKIKSDSHASHDSDSDKQSTDNTNSDTDDDGSDDDEVSHFYLFT